MKQKRILLVYANPLSPEKKHLPYGLIWLGQSLTEHEVRIVDPFMEYPDPYGGVQEEIARFSPDIIGIGLRNIDSQTSIELKKGNFSPPDGSFNIIYLMPEVRRLVDSVESQSAAGRHIPIVIGGGAYQAAPRAILKYLDSHTAS